MNIRRTILSLFGLSIIAILILIVLLKLSYNLNENITFKRVYSSRKLAIGKVFPAWEDDYKLSVISGNAIVLNTIPGKFRHLEDTWPTIAADSLRSFAYPLKHFTYSLLADSDFIYLFNGNSRKVYRFGIHGGNLVDSIDIGYQFIRCAIGEQGAIYIRAIEKNKNHNPVLIKYDPRLRSITKQQSSDDQMDKFGIKTDGILNYDVTIHSLIFAEFSLSCFYILDTNLKNQTVIKTIEGVDSSRMLVGTIGDTEFKKVTNLSPKYFINDMSYVYGGKLFVLSLLKAANDTTQDAGNATPIDIYDLQNDGKYSSSVLIPDYMGEKCREFVITKEKLFARYKSKIVKYEGIF